jgi:hypothetical protein
MSSRRKPILTEAGKLVADVAMILFVIGVIAWALDGFFAG